MNRVFNLLKISSVRCSVVNGHKSLQTTRFMSQVSKFVSLANVIMCSQLTLTITRYHRTVSIPNKHWKQRSRSSSTATGLTDSERLLIDSIKRRFPKKKFTSNANVEGLSDKPIVALSAADEYSFGNLCSVIEKQGLYEQVVYENHHNSELRDEVIHFTAKYIVDHEKREFFVFKEGSVVFWNMSSNEVKNFIC